MNYLIIIIFIIVLSTYYLVYNQSYILEKFALSSSISTNPALLKPDTYYSTGDLIQSNTLSYPINNGLNNCVEFPLKVYKEAQRFFTTNIKFLTNLNDTTVKCISYNNTGTVLFVGKTSGMVFWSNNFGTSIQTFTNIPSGTVTFENASIGSGNVVLGSRITPSNDKLVYFGTTSPAYWAPIQNGSTYYYTTQNVIGTVPGIQGYNGTPDNVFLGIGTNGDLYLQQQGAYYYRWLFSQQPGKVNSISLDQTVATAVMYKEGSITRGISPTSTIFMISFQSGSNVAKAPGGIGAEISTANTLSFKKVIGNPNNIIYLCAGEDLRAFAIDENGLMLICNDITKSKSALDWVILPGPSSFIKFSKVFYKKTLNDIAYAIDINGQVYVQNGVNAIFKQIFNLSS